MIESWIVAKVSIVHVPEKLTISTGVVRMNHFPFYCTL
jgi:hypothetical protein